MAAPAPGGGGSFLTSPLFLAAAAGGVVAAIFLLKGGQAPVPGTIGVTPSGTGVSGMAGQTSFAFTSVGSSDPAGGTLTFSWDFGDASALGTGAAVTHTYMAAGNFTVKLTVKNNNKSVVAPTASVRVLAALSGAWSGVTEPKFFLGVSLALTQTGASLGGVWTFFVTGASVNGVPSGTVTPVAYPGTVTFPEPPSPQPFWAPLMAQ